MIVLLGFAQHRRCRRTSGWTSYPPLSEQPYIADPGMDLWIIGLALVGLVEPDRAR